MVFFFFEPYGFMCNYSTHQKRNQFIIKCKLKEDRNWELFKALALVLWFTGVQEICL